jgi:hypothetical protein
MRQRAAGRRGFSVYRWRCSWWEPPAPAWYASNRLVASMHPCGGEGPDTVLHVRTDASGVTVVSFADSPAAARPGRWGMSCPGGSGMVGPIVARTLQRMDRVLLSGPTPNRN